MVEQEIWQILADLQHLTTGPLDVGVAAVAAVTAVTLSVPVGKLLTGLTSSMAARCATLSGPRGYSRIEKGWKGDLQTQQSPQLPLGM